MDWEMVSRCESALALSDERCVEMAGHCSRIFNDKKDVWLADCSFGSLPRLQLGSKLLVYPVLTRVCLFPIKEDEDDDLIYIGGATRPLFYSEVSAMFLKVLNQRLSLRKRKKRKKKVDC